MNAEVDYGGSGSSGNGKLRQWLIEQVDSGKYPGLVWENEEKNIFRIPWKHAGKQDYNRDEDAALFKAWALFKGKFREGIDKADPPTWKTRLRCALNKSNDFEELVERSQLDISDPYKVYRVIPEGAKKRPRQDDSPLSPMSYQVHSPYPALQTQMPQYVPTPECGWRDYCQEQAALPELPYSQCPCPPRSLPWQGPSMENEPPFTRTVLLTASPRLSRWTPASDQRRRSQVTTSSLEGCHITPEEKHYLPPAGPEVIPLPVDSLSVQRVAEECPPSPPSSLERGVLLWMGQDGLYARRLCQGRVYWQGGLPQYGDKLDKLEREVTCKLLHTQDYLTEIQSCGLHGRPLPRFQVEPLFARQLQYYAQQMGSHYYRSYEHPGVTEHLSTSEDYQRTIAHHHSSSLQE
ncbi:hypothetical protein FQN60_012736 [Etheostoma spectabile]|uniref:IRF tryptophan pentad repeat domain-containing protein n=1 Tax=Etheostoma spectabile TaxID=54343 RepID=A0A5J5DBZ3_9PERO|nr:hypothetical protein FQN60_012736 [Etheostoma spectabile]